jgi:hypothetical protein
LQTRRYAEIAGLNRSGATALDSDIEHREFDCAGARNQRTCNMKKLFIVAAALAATISTADAKCTKKSLNGSWALDGGTAAGVGVMSGGVYNVTVGSTAVSLNISSFSSTKCRGSGTGNFDGTPVTVKVAAEAIAASSSKPNHLLVTVSAGGMSLMFSLQRL